MKSSFFLSRGVLAAAFLLFVNGQNGGGEMRRAGNPGIPSRIAIRYFAGLNRSEGIRYDLKNTSSDSSRVVPSESVLLRKSDSIDRIIRQRMKNIDRPPNAEKLLRATILFNISKHELAISLGGNKHTAAGDAASKRGRAAAFSHLREAEGILSEQVQK
jgi:hypothetical protein